MSRIQPIIEKANQLRLKALSLNLETVLEDSLAKNLDTPAILEKLLDLELERRWNNAIVLRWRQSKLNEKCTVDAFDFQHHKSRMEQKQRILNLFSLDFVRNHADVIIIGNPGTGKTFLAKAIAYAACNANIKVLFTTATDMVNRLIASEVDHSLVKMLHYYQSPDLLVIDELGYLSLGSRGSDLFFQVISKRHQGKSSLITTNLPFADWGNIFDSTTAATAIADRLVYNSEVLILRGDSYRRKNTG